MLYQSARIAGRPVRGGAICMAVAFSLSMGCTSLLTSTGSARPPEAGRPVSAPSALISVPDTPPASALARLREREGYSERVYIGANGNLIAGYGHALTDQERARYAEGSRVDPAELARWDAEDTSEAWRVASRQAEELGEPRLTEALFAVVYQLGPNWRDIHKQTWRFLQARQWEAAAREVEDSRWFRQTPLRVRDFQEALRRL